MTSNPKNGVIIGVADHGGWAVLVTVAHDGTLLDRRRVELVDDDLPAIPHHHEAQGLPLDKAEALIAHVRASAEKHAASALDAVAIDVPNITGVTLRICPPLPSTLAERLSDYRSKNVADWVMYRQVLAAAAEARGWRVHWYDAKEVLSNAEAHVLDMRKTAGAPWTNDHKIAMAAALHEIEN